MHEPRTMSRSGGSTALLRSGYRQAEVSTSAPIIKHAHAPSGRFSSPFNVDRLALFYASRQYASRHIPSNHALVTGTGAGSKSVERK